MRFKYLKLFVVSLAFLFVVSYTNVNADTLQEKINSTSGSVVLEQNVTENLKIANGKTVTIDLNGNTITGGIEVKGTLIMKDSKGNGKLIANTGKDKSAIQVEGGKFTLESGTINNDEGYGVYGLEGGKAIVNGGTIDTYYSGLTGNNTTGDMYFTVNGGTIKAKYGPAIYMPGQVSLDVNGGNLVGGISLRMGTVNITGGNITAITSGIDNPSEYYSYNGNAWLPDAIYAFGGTYNSKSGNNLNINITGGVITNKNKEGSALAIYDLGKVSQSMKVSISGKAKLTTNSSTRTAYDVISLNDLGVTSPKEGFNNPSYIGKVSTNITGGIFSSINDKYISDGYVKTLRNGTYTVEKKQVKVDVPTIDLNKEVKTVTVGVTNYNTVKGVLLASLENSNIDTSNIEPLVDVNVNNKDESSISNEDKTLVKEGLDNKIKNATIASYFDISVLVKNSQNNQVLGNLTKLTDKINFTIAIPSNLTNTKAGMERIFYVVRIHDGKATVINTTKSKDGKSVSFATDKFSTYALAYKDVASTSTVNVKNPQTYDSVLNYIIFTLVTVGLSTATLVYLKKNGLTN